MTSFAYMNNLVLCLFVLLYAFSDTSKKQFDSMLSVFQGFGPLTGGKTLQEGKMMEMGNTFLSLPSMETGKALDKAERKAVAVFQPELSTKKVRIKEDERGLVISISADTFFPTASAELDIDNSRELLQKISNLLREPEFSNRKFRLEGHTDNLPTDPSSLYPTNWELSAARSINVLKYLTEFGVNENNFKWPVLPILCR
jgi:chemotaxis protein MotB